MKRRRSILIAVVGVAIIGVAVREYFYRRHIERRYHAAVEARRKLERQVGEVLENHERLKGELQSEQQRARELAEAFASTRGQLEETVARLAEESQNGRELQRRLAAMQQQMDQLQGELAVAVQGRQGEQSAKRPVQVQLERIVVSDEASASGLNGRVVSVHQDWGFVVINLGWDAVRIGDTVSIFRGEQLLAKARVDRIQEDICAATVLPEWKVDEVQVNDTVRIL